MEYDVSVLHPQRKLPSKQHNYNTQDLLLSRCKQEQFSPNYQLNQSFLQCESSKKDTSFTLSNFKLPNFVPNTQQQDHVPIYSQPRLDQLFTGDVLSSLNADRITNPHHDYTSVTNSLTVSLDGVETLLRNSSSSRLSTLTSSTKVPGCATSSELHIEGTGNELRSCHKYCDIYADKVPMEVIQLVSDSTSRSDVTTDYSISLDYDGSGDENIQFTSFCDEELEIHPPDLCLYIDLPFDRPIEDTDSNRIASLWLPKSLPGSPLGDPLTCCVKPRSDTQYRDYALNLTPSSVPDDPYLSFDSVHISKSDYEPLSPTLHDKPCAQALLPHEIDPLASCILSPLFYATSSATLTNVEHDIQVFHSSNSFMTIQPASIKN